MIKEIMTEIKAGNLFVAVLKPSGSMWGYNGGDMPASMFKIARSARKHAGKKSQKPRLSAFWSKRRLEDGC